MARWRGQGPEPEIPPWIRHEMDGGFVPSDWAEPGDFELEPWAAEAGARARWAAARVAWLNRPENSDVGTILLEQLRERCREKKNRHR